MPKARGMSGSRARTRSLAGRWITVSAHPLSLGVRRAQRACPGRQAEEGDFPMLDKLKYARTKDAPHPPHPHIRSRSVLNRPLRLARDVELLAALILSLF